LDKKCLKKSVVFLDFDPYVSDIKREENKCEINETPT